MLLSFDRGGRRFCVVVQFADTILCKRKSSRNNYMTSPATGHTLSARRRLPRRSKSSSHHLLFLAETPYDLCPLYLFMLQFLDKKETFSFSHVYALFSLFFF
jgi:hypothetical protein